MDTELAVERAVQSRDIPAGEEEAVVDQEGRNIWSGPSRYYRRPERVQPVAVVPSSFATAVGWPLATHRQAGLQQQWYPQILVVVELGPHWRPFPTGWPTGSNLIRILSKGLWFKDLLYDLTISSKLMLQKS